MAPSAPAVSNANRRRWASVVALSAGLHVLVLGGLAFRVAPGPRAASIAAFDVSLAPMARFVASAPAPATPKALPTQGRIAPMEAAPRHAAGAQVSAGEAGVDLFGPVFDDGMWPRPLVVASGVCKDEPDVERSPACRRELLLIGLATEPRAGSNPAP